MKNSSSSNKVLLDQVFVLHTRPYRDTSLLVEFFSQEHGRVKAIARSARGLKSRYQGRLQSFVPLLASYSGKNELKYLNHLELKGMPISLSGNSLLAGFYINELLFRLLQSEDNYSSLFGDYKGALLRLSGGDCIESVLRYFEISLLQELGYGINLSCDARSGLPIATDKKYSFILQYGFYEEDGRSVSADNNVAAFSVSGSSLIALREQKLDSVLSKKEAKRVMRYILTHHFGNYELKSRTLYC